MAINVDTVYKTVLLILNQQQRGYMTPDEFNKSRNTGPIKYIRKIRRRSKSTISYATK